MDWPNERYIRLFTRDTVTWKLLCWQAKALLPLIFRKVDRAGVLEVGDAGELGVVALVELPEDVVHVGLADLLHRGVVTQAVGAFIVPNFIEAQEASMSDKQRAIESRARRRDLAMSRFVTAPSRFVTDRHERSRFVTPDQTDPSLPELGDSPPPRPPASAAPPPDALTPPSRKNRIKPGSLLASLPEERQREVRTVLEKLSLRNGVAYKGVDSHVRLICARLDSGITELELRYVIGYCASDAGGLGWAKDDKARHWLRPETLFGPETVGRYLDAARAWAEIHAEKRQDAPGATNGSSGGPLPSGGRERGTTGPSALAFLFNRKVP